MTLLGEWNWYLRGGSNGFRGRPWRRQGRDPRSYREGLPGSSIRWIEDTFIRGYRQLALETPARRRDVLIRALDVLLSAFFLLLALPLALPIALIVLLTIGPPVFYRGPRVGRGGRVFTMLKFRTL